MCEEEDTAVELLTEIMDKEGLTVWATDKCKEIMSLLQYQREEVKRSDETKQRLYNKVNDLEVELRNLKGDIKDSIRSFNSVLKQLED